MQDRGNSSQLAGLSTEGPADYPFNPPIINGDAAHGSILIYSMAHGSRLMAHGSRLAAHGREWDAELRRGSQGPDLDRDRGASRLFRREL